MRSDEWQLPRGRPDRAERDFTPEIADVRHAPATYPPEVSAASHPEQSKAREAARSAIRSIKYLKTEKYSESIVVVRGTYSVVNWMRPLRTSNHLAERETPLHKLTASLAVGLSLPGKVCQSISRHRP